MITKKTTNMITKNTYMKISFLTEKNRQKISNSSFPLKI